MPALKPGTIFPTDEENAAIIAAAASDPDCPILTDAEWERARVSGCVGARKAGRPKLALVRPTLNMRVDAPILEHLRATGKGWQTRVNALLREAVEQGRV